MAVTSRPRLTSFQYTIGSFLSSVSLNIVSHDKPSNWRHAVLSQFAVCGVAILAWLFLPESARWHCVKGNETESKKILRRLNGKVEGYDVDKEYRSMVTEIGKASSRATQQQGGSYLEVFRSTNRVGDPVT